MSQNVLAASKTAHGITKAPVEWVGPEINDWWRQEGADSQFRFL